MLGRGFAGVLLAALAVASNATAKEPAPFAWSLISRFHVEIDGTPLTDANALARRPILVEPVAAICAAGEKARWRVGGTPATPRQRTGGRRQGCSLVLDASRRGRQRIEVTVGGRKRALSVDVRDRLVVALGDSIASGEGNPVSGRWLERRCHRAGAAGVEQAARLLAETAQHTSITFVSLACSGATIPKGVLGAYRGVEPRGNEAPAPAQVDALAAIDRTRPVDAVLLSVGANDIHFGDIVVHCVLRPKCADARFDPLRRKAGKDAASADVVVAHALAVVGDAYDRLARELRPLVRPANVVLTEYFDPTQNRFGRPCSKGPALPGVSAGEARWAAQSVVRPLNREMAAAVARNGWTLVPGIEAIFARHGWCAGRAERWVNSFADSGISHTKTLAPGPRLAGVVHPNTRGHLAIADQLAPVLGAIVGIAPPRARPVATAQDGFPWGIVVGGLAYLTFALMLAGLLVTTLASIPRLAWPAAIVLWLAVVPVAPLIVAVRRLMLLAFAPGPHDSAHASSAPRIPALRVPRSATELAAKTVSLLLSAGALVGFVTLVGAAVLWVRFAAARLPADQAVAVVGKDELVALGARVLVLFSILGIVAAVIAWLLDGEGRHARATRRGLGVLLVAELYLAVRLGDFPADQRLKMIAGFAVGAVLLHFLVDRALALGGVLRSGAALGTTTAAALVSAVRALFHRATEREPTFRRDPSRPPTRSDAATMLVLCIWRGFPIGLIGGAVAIAATQNEASRWPVFLLLGMAALAFVLPGGIAGDAVRPHLAAQALEPARVALALGGLICLVTIVVRDEPWLAGAAALAVVLAGGCLGVAAASEKRFAPYGLAVLLSVPLYGAGLALMRGIDTPELQPFAAIASSGGRPFCGVYVGESDGRLWYARVETDERAHVRVPRRWVGRLASVKREATADVVVGPLQPVTRAREQARVLAAELSSGGGDDGSPCDGARADQTVVRAPLRSADVSIERKLAQQFQPELIIDRRDGFWPVSVNTLFAMRDRRSATCRRVDPAKESRCVRVASADELPWSGGDNEWLEYPAANDATGAQRRQLTDALGTIDASRTAQEYFLVTRGGGAAAPWSVQFWFFYTFNFQPIGRDLTRFGFHEGDFESAGVLLSARTRRPRYVWMARHADEGRVFAWEEDALQREGDHPLVFVARGSHASYEGCGRQTRVQAPRGLIDDRPTCRRPRQLHIAPEVTPLVDLSRTPWACWRGLFGHQRELGGSDRWIPYRVADAPRSPLHQQRFGGERFEPCRGIEDPGSRAGRDEEVLPDETAATIRAGAGRLELLVDECSDWQRAPFAGTYLVACDSDQLRRYVRSGFEDPGATRLRIDRADARSPDPGALSVPAVRRDAGGRDLGVWRVATSGPARADIFASCRQGGKRPRIVAALFPNVVLDPGRPLRVDDRLPGLWRLRAEDGRSVAGVAPSVAYGRAGGRLACGG